MPKFEMLERVEEEITLDAQKMTKNGIIAKINEHPGALFRISIKAYGGGFRWTINQQEILEILGKFDEDLRSTELMIGKVWLEACYMEKVAILEIGGVKDATN